ncbi:MAG: hypothetical protein COV59_03550 [Candidatus Magasanikbacteria bacterium CG11_big_fil_rev_8_21_14_0_20_39_34]|uniref:Nudix hydrolase domain-containing protein n=1 Tax=Candidatus Magasanikbacteria bacterium CG11_big_fil_rev_8_21_14_0_20_39_34 TaxID=1974653 RepID=A0A2H0N5P5_9BACT|nr:MAG: hypothetical protein COV59_03550 [Candidatus Magasanikbacteria bacterium CG11_big_fil_rev_8_21_14_0_20_39_34]
MNPFEKLSEETIHENPWWTYKHDTYVLPDGIGIGNYYYGDTPGSVMIIPRMDSGEYVLVNEYKYLVNGERLTFPVGGMKLGEEPLDAAARELQEETGMTCDNLTPLGSFEPNNGIIREKCFLFLAHGLHEGAVHFDETEKLTTVKMSKQKVEESIKNGELLDGFALAAWVIYSQKTKD